VIYSNTLLEAVSKLSASPWDGVVFRHTFGSISPRKENQLGARWNPAEVPAIYCSLERETAIAEVDFHISLQPFKPTTERRVHRVEVRVPAVVDLTNWEILERLGISRSSYATVEPPRCKEVGGAIAFLGHSGILVPSARHDGLNLVVYPTADLVFRPIDFGVVPL
jgi:RES domain-containing protein